MINDCPKRKTNSTPRRALAATKAERKRNRKEGREMAEKKEDKMNFINDAR